MAEQFITLPELEQWCEAMHGLYKPSQIKMAVMAVYNLTEDSMRIANRKPNYADARKAYVWFMRRLADVPNTKIASHLGKDHTTTLHAYKRAQQHLEAADPSFCQCAHHIYLQLKNTA